VIRPGEADAGVLAPIPGCAAGVALTVDGNPRISRSDPYLGGALAVVEAVRNLVCVGAVPQAITDCLNYGSPEVPEVFFDFREGVRGLGDACRGLGRLEAPQEPLPVISGNVSFYNQSSLGGAVAPSPIVCGVGTIADIARTRSMQFKRAGNALYRLGAFDARLGGSLYAHFLDPSWRGAVPAPDYAAINAECRTVLEAQWRGIALASHDISEGGLIAAVVEMALGAESLGRIGATLDLRDAARTIGATAALLGEAGGFLLEIDAARVSEFEALAKRHGASCARLGTLIEEAQLALELDRSLRWSLDELAQAREATMPRLLRRRSAEVSA
jgi:phosphoribosylformylglycinamidine synthase